MSVRVRGGYTVHTDRISGKVTQECDTFACTHCGGHTLVPPRATPTELGGYCGRCAGPTCPRCARKKSCVPFEAMLARMEARGKMRRSLDAAC